MILIDARACNRDFKLTSKSTSTAENLWTSTQDFGTYTQQAECI